MTDHRRDYELIALRTLTVLAAAGFVVWLIVRTL